MGGEIDVESPFSKEGIEVSTPEQPGGERGGVGSRFFFTLPFQPATKEIATVETLGEQLVVHLAEGYQVEALVVDDVDENREILRRFLADIGVSVRPAENGLEALKQVRQSVPDIVFMDIRMPIMDGLEATQRIWQEFGREALKIVAVSASTLVHEQQKYLSFGFDAFLDKPLHAQRIYECLASLLRLEYQYADEATSDTEGLSPAEIPEELLLRLKEAAEIYSTTKLRQCLNEMERLYPGAQHLAEHLRGLVNNYDVGGVLNVLAEIAQR